MLGYAYVLGRGVIADDLEGLKWLEKAAEQGNEEYRELANQLRLKIAADALDSLDHDSSPQRASTTYSYASSTSSASSTKPVRSGPSWEDAIVAAVAAVICLQGAPLYAYTMAHARELNSLMYLLYQVGAIVAAGIGGAAALGLLTMSYFESLTMLGIIAGLAGGLVSLFCYEIPEVQQIMRYVVLAVIALAALRIIITVFRKIIRR